MLARIGEQWPYGLHPGNSPGDPVRLGLRLGDQDLRCIKLQQVDFEQLAALHVLRDNMLLLASRLPEYMSKEHRGVIAPVPYFQPRPSGKVETGIAYFCAPDARDALPESDVRFDDYLGRGATAMIGDMQKAIVAASKTVGIRYQYFLSAEPRHAGVIGKFALRFLIVGSTLLIVGARFQHKKRRSAFADRLCIVRRWRNSLAAG